MSDMALPGSIEPAVTKGPDLDKGFFVASTLLVDATNQMHVAREEVFGPVVVVMPLDDEDEGIAIANDSSYGLYGYVFTGDTAHGMAVARRLRSAVGLPERDGVLVRAVETGSPADRAGFERGDLIVAAGERPVERVDMLYEALDGVSPGGELAFTVLRALEERPLKVQF